MARLTRLNSRTAIARIVEIQLKNVTKRLTEKEIELAVSPTAIAYLAEKGYNPTYGARPLKRLIQDKILTKVAQLMVSKGILEGGSISVDVAPVTDEKGEREFIMTIMKKGKSARVKRATGISVSKEEKQAV